MNNNQNISQEELELIDRYLNWQLTAGELTSFEQLRASDANFAEKVDELRLLSLGIQESMLTGKLDDFHEAMTPRIRLNRIKRLAIAAAVMLCVGVSIWLSVFRKDDNEKLYAAHYRPDPGLPTLMGVSDHYEFDRAMVDYKTGDYRKALDTWRQLLQADPKNDTLNYFIASAHLASNDSKQAIVYFDKVLADDNSVFLQDARWYKALSLLKAGEKEAAIVLLKNTDHPDKEVLLRKLEER